MVCFPLAAGRDWVADMGRTRSIDQTEQFSFRISSRDGAGATMAIDVVPGSTSVRTRRTLDHVERSRHRGLADGRNHWRAERSVRPLDKASLLARRTAPLSERAPNLYPREKPNRSLAA